MRCFLFLLLLIVHPLQAILVGQEVFFEEGYLAKLQGKRVGLVTNQTAINHAMETTLEKLTKKGVVVALFAPEHGLDGATWAGENVAGGRTASGIPIHSLHGKTRRPTPEMLAGLDAIIFDIQDIGSRSYTFTTTLYYLMEEAKKAKIDVIVFDRPNPLGGLLIDGPMLEEKWRSFVGYINVPYCHGMTIGELARYFNDEYRIGCRLTVIPMRGWRREMLFSDTGMPWVPTSPNIPEPTSPFFYPTTGILGELGIVNIGIGYTLPFKVIGAPWIQAEQLAQKLNSHKIPGALFSPFHFRPFYGTLAKKECNGVMIHVLDPKVFRPVHTEFIIMATLKSLYPQRIKQALTLAEDKKEMFCKVNGTERVWELLKDEGGDIAMRLEKIHERERKEFLKKREKYLLY